MACSTPPMYWLTGSHRFTASDENGPSSIFGFRNRRKYQEESTNVSMVSVSRRAGPPHEGHVTLTNAGSLASGDSPCGEKSASSGSRIGRSSTGTPTSPQDGQWTIGMGGPQ